MEATSGLLRELKMDEKPGMIDENASLVRAAYREHCAKMDMEELNPQKDASHSDKQRSTGNAAYSKGRYDVAADLYSSAILTAPLASEQLKLAYANRSAAYLALKRREPCLKDVERALALGCDGKLLDKLQKRKAAALNMEQNEEDKRTPFEPPSKIHPEISSASDAVRMVRSEEWGWHMVAARDVLPGETLVFEKPYITQIFKAQFLRCCYECCSKNDAMIPCEGCGSAIYCDEECRGRSLERGHRFECPLMLLMLYEPYTPTELFALRSAVRARCDASSWSGLRSLVRACERTPEDGRYVYEPDSYASIYKLETDRAKRSAEEIEDFSFMAANLLLILKKYTAFFEDAEENDFWFFGGLLLHHIMVILTNMNAIELVYKDHDGYYARDQLLGHNLSVLSSRINHSCAPNVLQRVGNKMTALIAVRPIKKGQQMFISYGTSYECEDVHERRSMLLSKYKFRCQCVVCTESWPLYTELVSHKRNKNIRKKIFVLDDYKNDKLRKGDKDIALNILPLLYKNATLLEPYVPCQEFAANQEMIRHCWSLFPKF